MFQVKVDYSLKEMEPEVDNLSMDHVKIQFNKGDYEETEIILNEKQMQQLADILAEIGYMDSLKDKIHQLEEERDFHQEQYNNLFDKMVDKFL